MPQAQAQELEELNRELRQCNLQQFIQQTGAALPPAPRPDRAPPATQVSGSGGWLAQWGPSQLQTDSLSPQDLMPPAREKPLPGGPRSPALVSSLSPEGMSLPDSGRDEVILWPLSPLSLRPLHSCPHETELLEVAASAQSERPLLAQPWALMT